MNSNWDELDAESLKKMYNAESAKLKDALLNGSSWEETRDQRRKVTELSIALHKKMHSSENPAESPGRSESRKH